VHNGISALRLPAETRATRGSARVRWDGQRFSFQLANQAIDSNQNSKSEMHCQRRNKHQHSQLDAYYLSCQQKNNRPGETSERSSHANSNLWRSILRHRSRGHSLSTLPRPLAALPAARRAVRLASQCTRRRLYARDKLVEAASNADPSVARSGSLTLSGEVAVGARGVDPATVEARQSRQLFAVIRNQLPPGARLLTRKPTIMALYNEWFKLYRTNSG
jgi:hypothetical protein